jgi:16S rRNA (cytidine1402-2'-O)-methyltransferase
MTTVYLIPSFLSENAVDSIPPYVIHAIKDAQVIFAENERTARRFMKAVDSTIIIDQFEWHTLHKSEEEQIVNFKACIQAQKNIAIISEAGCPGIADPGQILTAIAQEMGCIIKPLIGPSSILLGLMASGLNGQQFEFVGYLPIDQTSRIKKIKELESNSSKQNSTKIFIETPYRNNQLLDCLIKNCSTTTKLCVAKNITGENEQIITKSIKEWSKSVPDLHKIPVIFLLHGN